MADNQNKKKQKNKTSKKNLKNKKTLKKSLTTAIPLCYNQTVKHLRAILGIIRRLIEKCRKYLLKFDIKIDKK